MEKVVLVYPKRDGKILGKAPGSPYTLMRLASLVPDSIPVEVWDENVRDLQFSSLRPGDIVGITSMTLTIDRAKAIAERVKQQGATVVVGGTHATLSPQDVGSWADVVNVGEAYRTWPMIIEDHLGAGAKPLYHDEEWADLDGLKPIPDRVISIMRENDRYWTPYLEITRGCPRNCSFCTAIRVSGQKMRLRPVDHIVEEIQRRKIKRFFLTDDNWGLNYRTNPSYVEEVMRALAKLKLTGWTAQCENIVANYPDLLDLSREAGLDKVFIGFESVNPLNKKDLSGKGQATHKQYMDVIKKIRSRGIGVVGLFVFGFDHDTPAVFQETLDFIKASELDSVSITVLTPFPGTPERAKLEKDGRLHPSPWSHYDTAHVTYDPYMMTAEQLREGYDWMCRQVYSPQAIVGRGIRSLRRYPLKAARKKAFGSFGTDVGYWKTYNWRHAT
jgi:radical SAM superfamily enzyme YgiQ (UPF0313 family)